MKKLTSLLAIASLALALTSASAIACEKSCGASKTTASAASATVSNVSGKSSCSSSKADATTTAASAEHSCKPGDCALSGGKYSVAIVNVDGMTCGGCEGKLTQAFNNTDGVVWVAAVSHSDGVAKIIYDNSLADSDDMVRLVNESGFKGSLMPAVAVTNIDAKSDGKAACTAEQKAACEKLGKAACSAEQKAACEKSGKACCADKGAKKTSATTTTASADHCKSAKEGSECSKLTNSERAGFCAKYCKSDSKDSKKDI